VTETLEERLAKAAGGGDKLSNYDGQVVTVAAITKEPSSFKKGETAVKATLITEDGNESELYVTPTAARQLLEIEEDLPLDLRVQSFPGQFGKTGYKFIAPNE
jgi:hypothetical protein